MKIAGHWTDIYLTKPESTHQPFRRAVVSSKISKKAVVRNLLKRRLRQILKEVLKKETYLASLNIAVVAKLGISAASFQELKKDVIKLFEKIRQSAS
ncbi:MAG: ribonuclease P protein component [Patescibacteria group bacterium]